LYSILPFALYCFQSPFRVKRYVTRTLFCLRTERLRIKSDIYIYIYVCVCLCVCVHKDVAHNVVTP
jgi:hypothetical protein